MSEFDNENCTNKCSYSENPTAETCAICVKEHNLPYDFCCLDICGEYEFCEHCDDGVYPP